MRLKSVPAGGLRLLLLPWLYVLGGAPGGVQAITLTTEPSIALQPSAPLAGLLEFSTDVPTTARFRVRSADEEWIVDSTLPKTEHAIPVLGLAPDTAYIIDQLQLRESSGPRQTMDVALETATSPLPQNFINIDVPTSIPDRMEPGFTLFEARDTRPATVFVDERGTVRWYLDGTTLIDGSLQPNGRLLGRVRNSERQSEIREYDLLGNLVAAWHPAGATGSLGSVLVEGVNVFHHDQQRLPNGNFLVLDQADLTIDSFPTSDTDRHAPTESRIVRQDVIHEFTPAGEVINSWSLIDMLDPVRIGYGVVRRPPAPQDWSHANAVVYDASDDSIIVSVRHQDAVIKFDKSTGDLKWILGTHEAWGPQFRRYLLTPVGGDDFEWPFHTHSPQILPDDPSAPFEPDDPDTLTLLIHDNGNERAIPFDPALADEENYTRAVEYRINEQDMT
ncbi:MAG: aryl-sulfate sulfotransferase, partial [Planctomycetota bacterium]